MVEPADVDEGMGAVLLPTPPIAVVYHNKLVPVAVSTAVVAF